MTPSVLWLRKTLRPEALARLETTENIIPVVIDDLRRHGTAPDTAPAWGSHKRRFWQQAVNNLAAAIEDSNGGLIVKEGIPQQVLPAVMEQYEANELIVPREDAWHEQTTVSELASVIDQITQFRANTLYTASQLPFSATNTPDTFTVFNNKVKDAACQPPKPTYQSLSFATDPEDTPPLDTLDHDPDSRSSMPFRGGRTTGLDRIESYIRDGTIDSYADRRNEMHGTEYSSKLSPYLAVGCIGPHEVYWACQRSRNREDANDYAIDKLQFELHWREYYRWAMAKHGRRFFGPSGIQTISWTWEEDEEMFERWAQGRTGIPIIDACMRELNTSGYMSNRGRQLVASFLAHNLNIDWRWGARYMEEQLIDSDVYSNWCNWAYVAGVGTDSRNRYFNILKQAHKYDPDARFVKEWLPQLATLPATHAHEPWKLSDGMSEAYDVVIGEEYPGPIIDLEKSYKRARQRWV